MYAAQVAPRGKSANLLHRTCLVPASWRCGTRPVAVRAPKPIHRQTHGDYTRYQNGVRPRAGLAFWQVGLIAAAGIRNSDKYRRSQPLGGFPVESL